MTEFFAKININMFAIAGKNLDKIGGHFFGELDIPGVFLFFLGFQTAWIHIKMETMRSCQLHTFLFDYLQTCNSKEACKQSKLN